MGLAPKRDEEEEAPPNRPVLPNVDDPKPPPEDAAGEAPKPNEGALDPPNRLPPAAGVLPAAVEPNAGAEDVPKENAVGVLCEEVPNPVKPDITNPAVVLQALPTDLIPLRNRLQRFQLNQTDCELITATPLYKRIHGNLTLNQNEGTSTTTHNVAT